jgi:hypothetical protein
MNAEDRTIDSSNTYIPSNSQVNDVAMETGFTVVEEEEGDEVGQSRS